MGVSVIPFMHLNFDDVEIAGAVVISLGKIIFPESDKDVIYGKWFHTVSSSKYISVSNKSTSAVLGFSRFLEESCHPGPVGRCSRFASYNSGD